jgi:diguanylate cyclase
MLLAACYVTTALLLWLGAEIGARAGGRPRALAWSVRLAAVVLQGSALWWPTNALRPVGTLAAGPGAAVLLAWLPGLGLAALALLTARAIAARSWAGMLGGGCATLAGAYALAMLTTPGLFRLGGEAGLVVVGAIAALALALVASHLRLNDRRFLRSLRVAAVLLAAGVMTLALAASSSTRGLGFGWVDLGAIVAWIGLAAVLRSVLQQPAPDAEAHNRPARATSVDGLTGLPTRVFFEERLSTAAKRCEVRKDYLAVLFIDLDGFKPVNDTFGHSCGDRVLEQVGERLRSLTRGADVAARVGGDEFLLLLPGIDKAQAAAQLAKRLIETLGKPYRVDEREIGISCSVGIAMYPDGCGASKLIARADAAMYAAKRSGGSGHCFYAPEMDNDAQQNFELVRDLRQAMVRNELELFFQPKIDAKSGKVTAAEALLRWQHPTRGLVMPGQFIALAERTGLIVPLGNWVIEAACKQARSWRDKGLRMRVAINLSAYQMRQDDIAERLADALKRHRIRPSLLTCEITESAAMEDTRATQETFRKLGKLGVHLSIDDFGTGYSSLSYLRKLPAEELKIDRSFVQDLEHSTDARAVVDAVVKLAHALGLKVVAEGVENPRQQQILVDLGCDQLQGFLFAKPMTARALLLWAIGDRSEAAVFRTSLFGETRQGSRASARSVPA